MIGVPILNMILGNFTRRYLKRHYIELWFSLSRFSLIKMVFSPLTLLGTTLPDEPLRRNISRKIPTHDLIFVIGSTSY